MILDTCALLWLVVEPNRLTDATLTAIDESPVIAVSAITAFEIGQKYNRGLLELALPPNQWMQHALRHHQLSSVALSMEICMEATLLPPIHKDPFDRLIIATALQHDWPVVTTDNIFSQYGLKTLA